MNHHDTATLKKREIFTSIATNKQSNAGTATSASMLPNDEVYYPKLNLGNQCTSLDNLWMVGFLHHDKKSKEKKAERELGQMMQLPGPSLLPGAANALKRRSKEKVTKLKQSYSLADPEQQRLRDVSKQLSRRSTSLESKKQQLSPYHTTNSRIKKVLRNKNKYQFQYNAQMRSKLLEEYFLINRNEQEAAICLQCFWRRIVAIRSLHRLSINRMSAIVIQAAVRSMLTRIWLNKWKLKLDYFIVRCQAHLRRRITNRRFHIWRKIEFDCACKIQSIIRMFLGRCKLLFMIKSHAADIISSVYRGFRTRKKYINKRKSYYAIKIQTYVRIHHSKRFYAVEKAKKDFAANGIQRCWKGYLARKSLSTILFDRFKRSCQTQVRMNDAEIEYYTSILDGLTSPDLQESDQRSKDLERELVSYEDGILKCDAKIQELQNSLRQLTPRSVQQGWKEQLEKSLKIERATLTQLKIQTVFKTRKQIRYNKEKANKLQGKRQNCLKRIESLQSWSNELTSMVHSEERRIKLIHAKRLKRQSVADEKRKWAIELTTVSGKPIKQDHKIIDVNPESGENKLMDLLKMQSYLSNVSQMRKIVKPLDNIAQLFYNAELHNESKH